MKDLAPTGRCRGLRWITLLDGLDGLRDQAGELCRFLLALAFLLAAGPVRTSPAFAQADPGDIAGLDAIRGIVMKISGGDYVVKTPQGVLYKVETGVNTHFVSKEQESDAAAIHMGATVFAGGELDQKQHTLGAIFVAAVDAQELAEYEQKRAEFGKTWLAGTIVSIRGTQLVVKRPDDVTTTISVDENTSFRRRHESITLGDLQVGDGLTARGAMQKSSFAGAVLTVVDAREIREWSRLRDR